MVVRDRKTILLLILIMLLVSIASLYENTGQEEFTSPEIRKEFEIQGLTWRTISYYYHPGIYGEIYNYESNLRLIKKAKNVGANYLLIRVFYNGTPNGELIGNDNEAEEHLREAITMAHDYGLKIFLTPYIESKEYWNGKRWKLNEDLWTKIVLKWAHFAEKNKVDMFAPGVEMNLIMDKERVGVWYKEILPEIRKVYSGKVITAELYDVERWKILDKAKSFAGYDCIGLTVFPRKEYGGVSDIRSFEDYASYVEEEANIIDILSDKYNISCKLAVPLGLDYWKGSQQKSPIPDAGIVAQATDIGLNIFKKHNFTGVFISHWASEPDHFGTRKDVEDVLRKH